MLARSEGFARANLVGLDADEGGVLDDVDGGVQVRGGAVRERGEVLADLRWVRGIKCLVMLSRYHTTVKPLLF